jgi:hypothetical protein
VTWVPYKDGDPIPEHGHFWITIQAGPKWKYVDVAIREERDGEAFFWTPERGRCWAVVTHYAALDWPAPAEEA